VLYDAVVYCLKLEDAYNSNNPEESIPEAPEIQPSRPTRIQPPVHNVSTWFPHAEGYEDLPKILSGDVLQFQRYTDGGFLFHHWAIYIDPFKHTEENGEEIGNERKLRKWRGEERGN
jgi:hypothetical protein